MPTFRETPVTDAVAHQLLTEYFTSRAETFPVIQGSYHTALPTPEQFVPPAGVFLLVHGDDDTAVGCGGIRRLDDGSKDSVPLVRYEVKHLWLQPQTRGRGWGRMLLDELERRARDFGAGEVVLDTNSSLAAAGALYRRGGYLEVEPYNDNPNATNWYAKQFSSRTNCA